MESIVTIAGLSKTYDSGHQALKSVDLSIRRGEIFALLGPNGAGKTTLIGIICGLVRASAGTVVADGYDIARDYRKARSKIGLVPQELATNMFETVWDTVCFSRGLFGMKPDHAHVERVLKSLSLWEKKGAKISHLSGGMKRRVLIAKALAHEPKILFLDEPTAGVDVELRRDMWSLVRTLRDQGVTIILTTHYIEEAEEMADRIGVIDRGQIILVEEKRTLMRKLGKRSVAIGLKHALTELPPTLQAWNLALSGDGFTISFTQGGEDDSDANGVAELLTQLAQLGIELKTINTSQSSLEDIFVELVGKRS